VTRLTEHFVTAEFRSHDGTPLRRHQIAQLRILCRTLLEPLRREFGAVHVVSGVRSPRRNEEVGGAPHSYHIVRKGRPAAAADVRCARGTPADWYAFLDKCGAGGLGLYRTHVHADTRDGRARWSG
jgi:uncharacterized protein YcbK (DUF882 family)